MYKNKLTQEINHTDSQIWLSDLKTLYRPIFNINWISDMCGKIEPLHLKATPAEDFEKLYHRGVWIILSDWDKTNNEKVAPKSNE